MKKKLISFMTFVFVVSLFNFNPIVTFGSEQRGGYITVNLKNYGQIDDIANSLRIIHRSKNYKFLSREEYEELNLIIHRDEEIIEKGNRKGKVNPYFGPEDSTKLAKQKSFWK